MSLTRESILEFLELDLGIDISDIEPDTLIFSSGIIDSFALVTLLSFIETEDEIKIAPGDVTLQNLDSIERILQFSARARSAA